MTITTELRKLHKTMTGKDAKGETIDELISELNENYTGGGSGGTVDTEMSDSSENAVQNKVIKEYVDAQSGGTVVFEGTIDFENQKAVFQNASTIHSTFSQGKHVLMKLSSDMEGQHYEIIYSVVSAISADYGIYVAKQDDIIALFADENDAYTINLAG